MKIKKFYFYDILEERLNRFTPAQANLLQLKRINKIDFLGKIHMSTNQKTRTNMIRIKHGDFVISGINASKGAVSVYQGIDDIIATIHYSSYKINEKNIDRIFFQLLVTSGWFKESLKKLLKSGIKTEIKPKKLLSLSMNIPKSLKAQRRIAEQYSSILFQIDKIKINEEKNKILIKKFKEMIFQKIIEGRFIISDLETSQQEYLKRIKKSQEQKKFFLKKRQKDIERNGYEHKFRIPRHWNLLKLKDILAFGPVNGFSSKKAVSYDTGIKTLILTATTSGIFKPKFYKNIEANLSEESCFWIKKGDILVQRSNSLEHVGIVAVVDQDVEKMIYPDLMMKLQIIPEVNLDFIHLVLCSHASRKYFRTRARGTANKMPKINQLTLLNLPIPLPPKEEQNQIVHLIKNQKIDRVLKNIELIYGDLLLLKSLVEKNIFHFLYEGLNSDSKIT